MPVHQLPDRLAVPVAWARTFTVDGKLSARDLSYSIAVGWLAAQRDPSMDGQDIFLGDNGLRLALQRSRRDKADVENARVFRTSAAKAKADGIQQPAPIPSLTWLTTFSGATMVHRAGIVRDGDRQLQWQVPAPVVASMRVNADDASVELPWTLVQHSRNRLTVIVMLRLLAMLADNGRDLVGSRYSTLVPFADLVASLGLPAKSEPKETMRRFLAPAMAEINAHTGFVFSIAEKRTRYRSGPHAGKEGPLQGISIDLAYPAITTPLAYPAPRKPGHPWKPAPRDSKPAKPPVAPPAEIDNVTVLPDDDDDDMFGTPIPSGRITRPVAVSPDAKPGVVRTFRRNT